ncbi:MAG: caspase family protein [Planctomycetes bacterium]|nr:caspase family protein [Planctomycetota bacterium]
MPVRNRSFPVWLSSALLTAGLWSGLAVEARAALDWDPAHTWVFAVGVLEWQHPDIWPGFPAAMKNRRDAQLVEHFRGCGVPDEQIVFLKDSQAKKAQIQKRFAELLDETDEGDLLVFYYAGHGFREVKTGSTWFANYDAGNKNNSAWSVASIFKMVDDHFSGNRVLMLADCCHSGALYDEILRRPQGDVMFAAITSVYSHNLSTGNWTFTDSLLKGLRGSALVDLDGDRMIGLNEIARYTELEMAFVEGQKSMFMAAEQFPREAHMAPVKSTIKAGVGQRVEVEWKGKWYKSVVTDVAGGQSHIHYQGYDSSTDEWVTPNRIRPYQPREYPVGTAVEVKWDSDGRWYPAKVTRTWYGLHMIHYDSFTDIWDEWVGPTSIRLPKGSAE